MPWPPGPSLRRNKKNITPMKRSGRRVTRVDDQKACDSPLPPPEPPFAATSPTAAALPPSCDGWSTCQMARNATMRTTHKKSVFMPLLTNASPRNHDA
jgi:hypothetical protein